MALGNLYTEAVKTSAPFQTRAAAPVGRGTRGRDSTGTLASAPAGPPPAALHSTGVSPLGNGYRLCKSRRTGEKLGGELFLWLFFFFFFTASLRINGTSACRAGMLPFIDLGFGFFFFSP